MSSTDNPDDGVSVIHNRFSLTLLNPSSHYFSLAASLAIAVVMSVSIHLFYLPDSGHLVMGTIAAVAVLFSTQLLDTRFTPKKEYSKSLHSSLFANLLWMASVLSGLAAAAILGREPALFLVALGLFLFASFRIGIYTTTLGVSLRRAWAICMVQPLAMFVVLVPQDMWIGILLDPLSLAYGISFMIIATAWSHLTDIAGRPGMKSTHKTIQAYLASQAGDYEDAENIMEQRAGEARVSTAQIRLWSRAGSSADAASIPASASMPPPKTTKATTKAAAPAAAAAAAPDDTKKPQSVPHPEFRIVIPDIHPGPYHPVGGSNIPYLIYKNLSSSAMVMHSVSDHALNLPSQAEVQNYLGTFDTCSVTEKGLYCTEPVTVTINKARVTGLLFGRRPLLFLSLSPHGMEDIPSYIKSEIETYAKNRGFSGALIVDCHNAMGPQISDSDGQDMLKAVKSCFDNFVACDTYPIEFGYANSDDMEEVSANDLGMGGLGVVCLGINGSRYCIGWADANNMENGVREKIVENLRVRGYEMLEICTSDTHFSRVKARNRNGYYHLGLLTPAAKLSEWFESLASDAQKKIGPGSFEILENDAVIRVMGSGIFDDYSKALENSLRITKYFALGGVALFITGLFL